MGGRISRRLKELLMFAAKAGSQSALVSFVGAVVWAGVATLAGARQAPMGVIELMLLFGTLVVVPLTLELGQEIGGPPRPRLATTIRVFQPLAATATVAALWVRPGIGSAALSAPWSLLGLVVALNGLATLARTQNRSIVQVAIALAGIDLGIAGAWFGASRAGLRPMGFQEPDLLTAVHFHYIGFATAILAAAAVRLFEDRAFESKLLRPTVWLMLFLPFVLAAGFVLSPMVRMVAAVALAIDIMVLTGLLVWLSRGLVNRTARAFLRLSGTSALIGLILAGVYAVRDHIGRPFLTMLGMARTHGLLSGLGFVLLGTLAFWIEIEARSAREGFRGAEEATEQVIPRKPPCAVSRPIPEFVAREFYDR